MTTDLLSEFFYDLIARIPPGILVLLLYFPSQLDQRFAFLSGQDSHYILRCFALLALSWIIGFLVDGLLLFVSFWILLAFRKMKCERLKDLFRDVFFPVPSLVVNETNYQRDIRRQGYFVVSMSVMSRSMALVFASGFIKLLPESIGDFLWTCRYAILCLVGLVGFGFQWFISSSIFKKLFKP